MTTFERIKSGVTGMDEMFDSIRLGDNVVWQVSALKEFQYVAQAFVCQAIADGRNLIYVRFAGGEPLIEAQEGLKICEIPLTNRFEKFTVAVRNLITQEGRDAFYVFDCLSELQVAWNSDLMMGNFFRVTCPYLFELDTVAYFPILRGNHSFEAVAKIRDTTQLFTDVYSNGEKNMYFHPLKVWNRYSTNMFLAHQYNPATGEIKALTDGLQVSRFYQIMNGETDFKQNQKPDSWDRFFAKAEQNFQMGGPMEELNRKMRNMMMSRDERMRKLLDQYFTTADYFKVRDRMIGTGMIGGKSCGMLLARKIVETELPECFLKMEPHDSFFIGSDVFYIYIVENQCWGLRVQQRQEQGYYELAEEFKKRLQEGHFPANIEESFKQLLDYFGQSPIIVRSSSILEDGFGNAFAGKYESVFCVNRGTLEERLTQFEKAVKIVYASTMDLSALEYRKMNGLEGRDEQMALLVQRVSGSYYGDYYMPSAAGVGYSHSTYRFLEDMDPNAGLLRLVMGLGTKAVDRTKIDYPRIVSLDRPKAQMQSDIAMRHRFSQHYLDLLDLKQVQVTEKTVEEMLELVPDYVKRAVAEHDTEAENRLRQRGDYRNIFYVSCMGLCENPEFIATMQKILQTLQEKYQYPVDIEYTVNVGEQNEFDINLLQCRPLQVQAGGEKVRVPEVPEEKVYFHLQKSCMGRGRKAKIDVVVRVDPYLYYTYPYQKKREVTKIIGEINHAYKKQGKCSILVVPGRIGTSSPELGVPVSFSDISGFMGIFEVAYSKAGYAPELSYGSHMFQDLVEADIFYGAILEERDKNRTAVYQDDFLMRTKENKLKELLPHSTEEMIDMIHVAELTEEELWFYYDELKDNCLCGLTDPCFTDISES